MKPEIITFTGADDNTSIVKMQEMAEAFPQVEFGILVSASNEGSQRYPSKAWLREFVAAIRLFKQPTKVAVHIQGRLLRNLVIGGDDFTSTYKDLLSVSQRIQLNFHGAESVLVYHDQFFAKIAKDLPNFQFIFQCDGVHGQQLLDSALAASNEGYTYVKPTTYCPLFDQSGGAGVLPGEWPKSNYDFVGYAGGLGPQNITEQLPKIQAAANGKRYWIDMETHVCDPVTGLKFDAMVKVLEQVNG